MAEGAPRVQTTGGARGGRPSEDNFAETLEADCMGVLKRAQLRKGDVPAKRSRQALLTFAFVASSMRLTD